MKFLVENGVGADHEKALSSEAEGGLEEIVRFLVEKGARADNKEALIWQPEAGTRRLCGEWCGSRLYHRQLKAGSRRL